MLKFLMLACAASLSSLPAHAEKLELLTLSAEKYPSSLYTMGVEVDEHHQIQNVFFQDASLAPEKQRPSFLMNDLSKGIAIITAQGYDMVRLTLTAVDEDEYLADIDFMTNGLTKGRVHNYLGLRWNAQRASFDLFYKGTRKYAANRSEGRVITQGYVATRRWFGREVGILSIQFN
jgi:hypothetical protein